MSVKELLLKRSDSKCELCASTEDLQVYAIPPNSSESIDDSALLCATCFDHVEAPEGVDINHWRCLNDSMWNPNSAVQVVIWRILNALRGEGWPLDLLDMLYLDDETLAWAKKTVQDQAADDEPKHVDSNGVVLEAGDTVVLIKDLPVKGGGFTAKRGTAVRNISLVQNNVEHIEGRVNNQQIVILTEFVKK
ncbi:MAG: PhnA domain-containing protein [Balneolaceae bacterium]